MNVTRRTAYLSGEHRALLGGTGLSSWVVCVLQFCIQRFINFVIKLGFGVSQTKAIMTLVSGIPMGPPRLPLQRASKEFIDNAEAKLKSLGSYYDL
ncbi:N-acetylneuraminate lyase [Myotis davidii]|uniref:N-acetylneuraminate lyase n=1 Tax=Myotis davidii TaxID=225400 RepID=L5MHB3_MYODS|nr:N-acetylneuraminate lyase [Myotis davidii]